MANSFLFELDDDVGLSDGLLTSLSVLFILVYYDKADVGLLCLYEVLALFCYEKYYIV